MLRVDELAKRLNLSQSKIYAMVQRGEIEHHRIGGSIRFSEENIAQLLNETKMAKKDRGTTPSKKIPNSRPKLKFRR